MSVEMNRIQLSPARTRLDCSRKPLSSEEDSHERVQELIAEVVGSRPDRSAALAGRPVCRGEIKIGVLYPLTGGAAAEGRELRAGAELAAEIANNVMPGIDMTMAKNAGIKSLGGAKIKLIFKDHEGNPTLGADLAKKLILDDKVVGILGCYHSAVTKTVSAVCEQYGVPMINDSSTSPGPDRTGLQVVLAHHPARRHFTKDLFEFLKGLTEGKVKGRQGRPQGRHRESGRGLRKDRMGLQCLQIDRDLLPKSTDSTSKNPSSTPPNPPIFPARSAP